MEEYDWSDPFSFFSGNNEKEVKLTLLQYKTLLNAISVSLSKEEHFLSQLLIHNHNGKEGCVHMQPFYQQHVCHNNNNQNQKIPPLYSKEDFQEDENNNNIHKNNKRYFLYCCDCVEKDFERYHTEMEKIINNHNNKQPIMPCPVEAKLFQSINEIETHRHNMNNNHNNNWGNGILMMDDDNNNNNSHPCYLLTAGSPSAPLLVLYCHECHCFSPLTTFTEMNNNENIETLLEEMENGVSENKNTEMNNNEEEDRLVSDETVSAIVAKLLLILQFLYDNESEEETNEPQNNNNNEEDDFYYLFLYKPILFSDPNETENETNTELLEEGVEETYMRGVLPAAAVMQENNNNKLLMSKDEKVVSLFAANHFSPSFVFGSENSNNQNNNNRMNKDTITNNCVFGFVMKFPLNPLQKEEKLNVLRQHGYKIKTSFVFIEDTQEWKLVSVPYHDEINENNQEFYELYNNNNNNEDEGISQTHHYTIQVPLPSLLWTQYCEEHQLPNLHYHHHHVVSPLSLSAQSLVFFARVMLVSRVMGELLERKKE